MIVRLWHGITKNDVAEKYKQYVLETGVAAYRSTPGNINAQIWQKQEGELTHIWTVSWWQDYESIQSFAGEDYETARYYEEDKKYLLEFEPKVFHAEVSDFTDMNLTAE